MMAATTSSTCFVDGSNLKDAGEYIESDEDAIAYFNAMAETGDSTLLQASLDDISKARGVIQIAAGEAGVGRETE